VVAFAALTIGAVKPAIGELAAVPVENRAFAISIALRVKTSCSPSSNASIAIVVALRAPGGRPLGLPDLPGWNFPAACFRPVLSGRLVMNLIFDDDQL